MLSNASISQNACHFYIFRFSSFPGKATSNVHLRSLPTESSRCPTICPVSFFKVGTLQESGRDYRLDQDSLSCDHVNGPFFHLLKALSFIFLIREQSFSCHIALRSTRKVASLHCKMLSQNGKLILYPFFSHQEKSTTDAGHVRAR